MKKYITLIFCLIGLSTIAANYNTQEDVNKVVNAWATKWNITYDVNERFERLTGANPNDLTTFNAKFNAYVEDFFGRKTTTATKEYIAPITKQYILELNHTIDESFQTILSHNGISGVVNNKFIRGNSIVLNINVDGDYSLNINDGYIITFQVINGVLTETITPTVIEKAPEPIVEWYANDEVDKSFMLYALNYRDNTPASDVTIAGIQGKQAYDFLSVDVSNMDSIGKEFDAWNSEHYCKFVINKGKTRLRYVEEDNNGYVDTWSSKIISYMESDDVINLIIRRKREDVTVLIWKDNSKVIIGYEEHILKIKPHSTSLKF